MTDPMQLAMDETERHRAWRIGYDITRHIALRPVQKAAAAITADAWAGVALSSGALG
jgi:hypothetical protein